LLKKRQGKDKQEKIFRSMGALSFVYFLFGATAYFANMVDKGLMDEKYMIVFDIVFIVVILKAVIFISNSTNKK